jgi:protease-4
MKNFFSQSNQEKRRVSKTLRSLLGRREVIAIVLICILAGAGVYVQLYTRYPSVERRNIVGIIRVEGYIESPTTASLYVNLVNQALFNESVKAVVLVVDSGGGYADYCEEIYLDLLELNATKPLEASVITALSGGYYIAMAAEHIYALPTSFVGSIGVIGSGPPVLIPSESELETGAYKITGFSTLLFPFNMSHALNNFVSAVEKNRGNSLKLSSTQLKEAKIYLGTEALEAGLVDEIGSLQKAIQRAAEKAKLVQYEVVELGAFGTSSNQSSQSSSNYTPLESQNLTLEALDKLHPPPAIHYIYLPSQVITQSSQSLTQPAELATGNGDVLVDQSHGNQISWWNLDILIGELAKRNATVSFVSQRDELDSKLAEASCLIVASPTEVYTDTECDSIAKFVDKGGVLVMFFDPSWEYIGTQGLSEGIIGPINSLSTRFGLSFAKGYLYNEEENFGLYRNIYIRNFASGQLTQNLRSLVLFTSTHIRSTGKELAWTSNNTYSSMAEKVDNYATIVSTEKGNGTVIAFGDLTFLSEPYCYVDDNYQLILNLASLIAKTKP